MAKMKRQFVDGRYGQIHLRIAQPAVSLEPPLLLMHMFPQSGRNFSAALEKLANRRVVVAPDFPGFGESDHLEKMITAEDYAASIWDVVDELELTGSHDRVDLFGIHAGSKIAVEFVLQRPDAVRQLILCSAAVLKADDVKRIQKALTRIPLDEAGTRFSHLWAMLIRNCRPHMTFEKAAESFSEMLRGGEKSDWGNIAVLDYNERFPERLKQLRHHVNLINPGDDLYDMTKTTVNYLDSVTLYDKPHWKHGFPDTNAEEFASLLEEILASEPASPEPVEVITQ